MENILPLDSPAFSPEHRLDFAFCALKGGLYIIGGRNRNGGFPLHNPVFDFQRRSWTEIAPLPIRARAERCLALVFQDRIHLLGGFMLSYRREHHVYDPAGDAWSVRAPLSTPRGELAGLAADQGMIILGGVNRLGVLDAHEVFADDKWSSRRPLPRGLRRPAAVMAGGEMHVMGGRDSANYGHCHYAYDPAEDTWRECATLPRDMDGAAAFARGDTINLMNQTAFLEYEKRLDSWIRRPTGDAFVAPGQPGAKVPAEVNFGIVPAGDGESRLVRIENEGDGLLRLSDFAFTGDQGFAFGKGVGEMLGVGPRDFRELPVKFAPGDVAEIREYNAEFGMRVNSMTESSLKVPLKAMVGVAVLECETTLDFGAGEPGSLIIRELVLRNGGNSELLIQALGIAQGPFSLGENAGLPLRVPPAGEAKVSIEYRPASASADAVLLIRSNAAGESERTVALSGRALLPRPVYPAEIDFGIVDVTTDALRNLEISNEGDGVLRINSIEYQGSAFEPAELRALPLEIPPGESETLPIRYRPRALEREGGLDFTYSADGEQSARIALKGAPGLPRFEPGGLELDFEIVGLGFEKKLPFLIKNTGAGTLFVNEIFNADTEGEIQPAELPELPAAIAPDESLAIRLRYRPVEIQAAEQLILRTSDVEHPEFRLALIGSRGEAELVFEPEEVDFGIIAPGADAEQKIKIRNAGIGILQVDGLECETPEVSFVYAEDREPGFRLNPGEETEVTVRGNFADAFAGGRIQIRSNDPESRSHVIPVTAVVGRLEMSVHPEQLNFGRVEVPGRGVLSVRISNSGSLPLGIDALEISGSGLFTIAGGTAPPFNIEIGESSDHVIHFTPSEKAASAKVNTLPEYQVGIVRPGGIYFGRPAIPVDHSIKFRMLDGHTKAGARKGAGNATGDFIIRGAAGERRIPLTGEPAMPPPPPPPVYNGG